MNFSSNDVIYRAYFGAGGRVLKVIDHILETAGDS